MLFQMGGVCLGSCAMLPQDAGMDEYIMPHADGSTAVWGHGVATLTPLQPWDGAAGPMQDLPPQLLGACKVSTSIYPLPFTSCSLSSVRSAHAKLCHARDGSRDQPEHTAVQQPGQLVGDPILGDLVADRPPAPLPTAANTAEEYGVPRAAAAASQCR